jgi:hypothetical protein
MNAKRLVIWVAAAAAAIGMTTAAVTVANATGDGRDDVLSQQDVARELAGETGPPAELGPTPRTVTGDGETTAVQSEAGQLVVRCDGDLVRLESWSPNPGYRADDVVRGPTAAVIQFESDEYEDIEVVVWCLPTGQPSMVQTAEPDDHGGDRDDDNRGED